MFDLFSQFHFIRPLWLYALLPLIVIISGLMLKNPRQNQWSEIIDQHLLNHLLIGQKKIQQSAISPVLMLSISLLLSVIALAGPTWEKRPLPVFETEIAKVILLDLSFSMESTDVNPSRLIRAKYKINDLLSRTKEGQIALIVYAGDAFVISPLTTDAKTILTMIPALSPSLMPVLGSEPQTAFALAEELLTNAGVYSGQIFWITDGIDDNDYSVVAEQLKNSRHQISILAVGTKEGAPIPLADGQGFLKDSRGTIIIPTLNTAPLEQLANISNGRFMSLTADDRDIEQLLMALIAPQEFIASEDDLEMDSWIEFGPWLLLPVILIAALAFRKGLVVTLLLTLMPTIPSNITAAESAAESAAENNKAPSVLEKQWRNLWQTPDQQAAEAFNKDNHKIAADLFQQKDWKSAALYKSEQYNLASDLLSNTDTADANYNKGNALAKLGHLEEAIVAYNNALELSPAMEDAQFNKDLVEELLKQQKEEEKQQQDSEQQEKNDQQQDGEQQEGDQEGEEEQEDQENKAEEAEQKEGEEKETEQQPSELEQMTDAERDQVLEQWLRKIKDDPGGLLRRKMYMEYQRRQQQGKKLQDKGEKVW